MTRPVALLLAAVLAWPLAAPAAAAPPAQVSAAFGNTILIIDPDGRSRKIWLKPDGTWTGLSRRGLDLAGKWTVQGEKVCLKQSKPRLLGSICGKLPAEPDVSVAASNRAGKTVRLKLVKGRITE